MGLSVSKTKKVVIKPNRVFPEYSPTIVKNNIRRYSPSCPYLFSDIYGLPINDYRRAIYLQDYKHIYYKGTQISSLFTDMKTLSEKGSEDPLSGIEVFCGYSPVNDTFLFMHYEKTNLSDDVCPICLDPLWTDDDKNYSVRVKTSVCRHDLHYHCHKEIKDKGLCIAPCCKGRLQNILFHMKIVGYTIYKYDISKYSDEFLVGKRTYIGKFDDLSDEYNPLIAYKKIRDMYKDIIPCGGYNYCVVPS